MKRLAIITTHPIQYNAPLFRLLTERGKIQVKVFYTWGQSKEEVFDAKFGMKRNWDIPLLDGYDYVFVKNISAQPDSNRFFGIINPGLQRELNKFQPDAVLVYRWSVYSHLKLMQCIHGPRLFFRGDSHLQNSQPGVRQFLKKLFLRFVYRNVNCAFYVGRYNKVYYQQYGFEEKELVSAPHAVDNRRFMHEDSEQERKAREERKALQIPEDGVVFLYAGKFYALKQLDVLIRAFKKIKGEEYRLLLYGSGEQEAELKTLAAGDTRILFRPFKNQSEMPVVYRTGDVFVLPSKSETWGLSVNEAMACGRPAIVSKQCGCAPELIVEGKTGFCFEAGDEYELMLSMQHFESRITAMQMGELSLKHIQHFSLEKVAEVIEKESEGLRLKV